VNPVPIIDTESKTDPSACGVNDGTITITASGGTPPLQYSIDGGVTFSGSGNFTGLGTGNYTVVVTDVNGCTVTGSILVITAPGAPSAPTAQARTTSRPPARACGRYHGPCPSGSAKRLRRPD
ncbi:MAG: SprB repeat-containing protein, partial [Chloroflexi bacterium]|nr:SprB repeat-containing protein [Chloroflexota bacterium]